MERPQIEAKKMIQVMQTTKKKLLIGLDRTGKDSQVKNAEVVVLAVC